MTFAKPFMLLTSTLLAASPVPPEVRVRVTTPVRLACPGMKVPFRAEVQGAPTQVCQWSVVPAGSGHGSHAVEPLHGPQVGLIIPNGTGFQVFTVRATSAHDDKAFGEASILAWGGPLMIAGPTHLINDYAWPQGWTTPCSIGAEPFLDVEAGMRFQAPVGALVAHRWEPEPAHLHQMVGYNQVVPWVELPPEAGPLPKSCLLSLRNLDGSWDRVCGKPGQPPLLQALGTYQEAWAETQAFLDLPAGLYSHKSSHSWRIAVHVRGLVPLAGNPALGPGDADGTGLGARFREPGGPALLTGGKGQPETCVVPDAAAQVLRAVTGDGKVITLCGAAGQAGFQDGTGDQARFNRPTYAATHPATAHAGDWAFKGPVVVADSGNHAIRVVDAQGRVTTLAGTGAPGYHDADQAAQAAFHDPRGVAVDPEGNVFVADRGNHAIRRIAPNGQVTTLAGGGKAGTADGAGPQAAFTDLQGLTLRHPYDGRLFVVDGHAVREVTAQGRVTTLLGKVLEPGYAVYPFGAGSQRWPLTGAACLNHPQGILSRDASLYIADAGNHALRCMFGRFLPGTRIPEGYLIDLVGHPKDPGHRWGLLQDGLPWLRTPAYGALDTPRGLVLTGAGDAWLSTGSCLANLSKLNHTLVEPIEGHRLPGGAHLLRREPIQVAAKANQALDLDLPLGCSTVWPSRPRAFQWTLEALAVDTQKPLAGPFHGHNTGHSKQIQIPPQGPGTALLRVKCLMDDGVTEFFQFHLTLQ